MPELIPAIAQAGALAWRPRADGPEIALVTARRGGWTIPKGHVEPGGSPRATALQECYEEAGLVGVPWPTPIGEYRYVKSSGLGPFRVSVFAMEVMEVLEMWPECRERERRWVAVLDAAGLVASEELAGIIRMLPGHL